jgi:branched-chain amino acid transport system ATP-binding protein
MSGGEQQMLAAGRALLSKPRLLLLDEPTLGLSPVMANTLITSLEAVRQLGLTVLIVEQNAKLALGFADSAYIMSGGRIVGYGEAEELLAGDILSNYLGVKV